MTSLVSEGGQDPQVSLVLTEYRITMEFYTIFLDPDVIFISHTMFLMFHIPCQY